MARFFNKLGGSIRREPRFGGTLPGSPKRERDSSIYCEDVSDGSRCFCFGQQHSLTLKTFPDEKNKVRAPSGALQSKKHIHRYPHGGINNTFFVRDENSTTTTTTTTTTIILPERLVFSPVPGFSCDTSQHPHFVGGQSKLYQISKRLIATTHTQLPAL